MQKKIIVGIDEVGRGPVAGPVSVGIAVVHGALALPGLTDSKLMTENARERVYALAGELCASGDVTFGVFSVPAHTIDQRGIVYAVRRALETGLKKLKLDPVAVELKLDGGLRAPPEFTQESVIHGDVLVPAISLASIVAKVERDRYMAGAAHHMYPEYGFNTHKGYGTHTHYAAIKEHGLSPLHRRSFLRNIVVASPHV